jgi:hypothetical protein
LLCDREQTRRTREQAAQESNAKKARTNEDGSGVSSSIVAMDRGYNDYALFGQWTAREIYFVTRLKA